MTSTYMYIYIHAPVYQWQPPSVPGMRWGYVGHYRCGSGEVRKSCLHLTRLFIQWRKQQPPLHQLRWQQPWSTGSLGVTWPPGSLPASQIYHWVQDCICCSKDFEGTGRAPFHSLPEPPPPPIYTAECKAWTFTTGKCACPIPIDRQCWSLPVMAKTPRGIILAPPQLAPRCGASLTVSTPPPTYATTMYIYTTASIYVQKRDC